jgi:hypothetical protein
VCVCACVSSGVADTRRTARAENVTTSTSPARLHVAQGYGGHPKAHRAYERNQTARGPQQRAIDTLVGWGVPGSGGNWQVSKYGLQLAGAATAGRALQQTTGRASSCLSSFSIVSPIILSSPDGSDTTSAPNSVLCTPLAASVGGCRRSRTSRSTMSNSSRCNRSN